MCFGSKKSATTITKQSTAAPSGDNNTAHEEMMKDVMSRKRKSGSKTKSPITSLISTGSLVK